MRTPIVSLAAVLPLLLACQPPGADSGDGGAEGAAALADGGTVAPQAQGADCITEPTTGVQICSAISICPNLVIDHDVYPNCGFRIRGQTIDIECACSGSICPAGAPATCDQAAKLLADQSEQIVCQQLGDGRCVAGTPTTSSSSSSSGASGSGGNGCDPTCAGECSNDPSCLRLCGC